MSSADPGPRPITASRPGLGSEGSECSGWIDGGPDLQPGGERVDDQAEAGEATAEAGVGIQKTEMQPRGRIHLDAGVGGVTAVVSRKEAFHGEIREAPC